MDEIQQLDISLTKNGDVLIAINQRPLLALIAHYESRFSNSIAGAYQGITLAEALDGRFARFSSAATVLVCDCGDTSCWSLQMTIDCYDNYVVWHHFSNPAREKDSHDYWDYRQLPPFCFDKVQYLTALAALEML